MSAPRSPLDRAAAWITPAGGGAISLGAVAILWFLFTGGEGAGLFPSPAAVAAAFVRVLEEGYLGASLGESLRVSLGRLLAGWGICVTAGVLAGFAMNRWAVLRDMATPWLAFYRPLPPLAYLSLIVLWLGVGEGSKITLLVLAGLPPVMIGTMTALQAVRQDRREALLSMGAGPRLVFLHLLLPTALPAILVNARIAFGACFAALIGAEMIAANSGVAWMVIAATNRGAVDVALVGVLTMSALALAADFLLRRLQHRLAPWTAHEQ